MTAELSQAFRTKREGVAFVLDALAEAFPGDPLRVYTVDGRFLDAGGGPGRPARGRRVQLGGHGHARRPVTSRTRILIDIGTTSTDIIPIAGGRVAARGPHRPGAALERRAGLHRRAPHAGRGGGAATVPLGADAPAVSAEGSPRWATCTCGWARSTPADYTVPTPDGRPATREFAGERLARVVCADREMLDEAAIDAHRAGAGGRAARAGGRGMRRVPHRATRSCDRRS